MKQANVTAVKNGANQTKVPLIKKVYELLYHEDVYRRMGGFLLWGFVLLLLSWTVGFFLIKTPFLRESFFVEKLFGDKGLAETFGKWGEGWLGSQFNIFKWKLDTAPTFNTWGNVLLITLKNYGHSLIVAFLFIFCLNHLRIKRFPLGYFFIGLYTIMIGFVIGTNSYVFPAQWNSTIGAVVTFARYGFWEWFALGLLAVSTLNWGLVASTGLLKPEWEKVRPFGLPTFGDRESREVFIFGLLFLLAASFAEARLIVHYGNHLL